jgi:heme-degrading monooxygenase HmoA
MKPSILATLATLALCACSSDDPSPNDGTAGGGPDPNDIDPEVQALYDCEETDFEPTTSLDGPGWDRDQGTLLEPSQQAYVVHTTQLILKPDTDTMLLNLTGKIIGQLQETPGFIAFALAGSEACNNVRTMGIWASEEAMYGMVNTGAHAEAMAETTNISLSGRVTHWMATPEELEALSWDEAKSRIADVVPSPIYD